MSYKIKCNRCDGSGFLDVLISAHDDRTETIKCDNCYGSGYINRMTDEEEQDYHDDYW